jgi:mitochondrial fission protein ELM1
MVKELPIIWVLKSFRTGDNAQALALAQRVGGTIVEKQLAFNRLAIMPNLMTGATVRMLANEARALLAEPWPDLVIATGRRTAAAALWIKKKTAGKAKVVQLGRPRLALSLFDLVITTPQYGLPSDANVVHLSLPFVLTRKPPTDSFPEPCMHLPKPWIAAVVGGEKFPLRLGNAELVSFGAAVERLAKVKSASVVLLSSPRSPKDSLSIVSEKIAQPKWLPSPELPNAYGAALASGNIFCVTSDSVSMVAEMLATGKPVYLHQLPESPLMPHWKADNGILAALARKGVLSPPRNTANMMRQLIDQKILGDLSNIVAPEAALSIASQQDAAVLRVRSLVGL